MATINVALSQREGALIDSRVGSGRYRNASEVLRAGLWLLEREHAEERVTIAELRKGAEQGWTDAASGRFDDVDDGSLDDFVKQLGVHTTKAR